MLVQQAADEPNKHLQVRLTFDNDVDELWFVDQRTFGGMFIDEAADEHSLPPSLTHIAPDPLSAEFDLRTTVRRMRAKQSPVKAVLLLTSPSCLASNIYADESLWRARLHWQRPAASVTPSRLREVLITLER